MVGEYLEASKVVEYLKLGEKIALPPNIKRLSETPNLTDHQEIYIANSALRLPPLNIPIRRKIAPAQR